MLNLEIISELNRDIISKVLQNLEAMISPLNALWVRERFACDLVATSTATTWEEFTLFLSEKFNALVLLGQTSSATNHPEQTISVGLTFEPEVIATFCQQLSNLSDLSSDRLREIELACRQLQPNDSKIQSQFTMGLLEIISRDRVTTPEKLQPSDETESSFVSVCQPIENALQQQIKQEKLLYQVTTQIRQSLELPVILSTAVEEVRRCLEVDRLLIYEFDPNRLPKKLDKSRKKKASVRPQSEAKSDSGSNSTTYEARKSSDIPSILELKIIDKLVSNLDLNQITNPPFFQANNDVEITYKKQKIMLELMQQAQVKSELLLPIIVEEKLWGLLIAHQCSAVREWQENEQRFLRDIAAHLAIAISQALLYRQLQEQQQILAERFQHQNQNLRDALIAAEAASRSKSEFLAAMSHELRTPLTCVIGMSSTLLRWSFGQLSDKQRHYLKTIHDSGERLLELINDILELSQLEAGNAVLNLQKISVIQIAEQMLNKMAEKASDAEISLEKDFQLNPEEDELIADSRRIQQIFYNLLSNAIKFTPAGGQVTVRIWRESQRMILQVEDTGVGISPEHKPLIFNKFQQLDSSYHRRYEGTGLGLALTKQLVELHGGWITVSSEVGVGSIFTVQLPIKKFNHNPSVQVSDPDMNPNSLGGIVLIEEDEATATFFCDLLTNAGYQVVWLVDAVHALMNVEVLQPKLVIIDTPLSDMEACELIEELRSHDSTSLLKILILMSHDLLPENLTSFWEAGADDYLIKPWQPELFLNKVKALLSS